MVGADRALLCEGLRELCGKTNPYLQLKEPWSQPASDHLYTKLWVLA